MGRSQVSMFDEYDDNDGPDVGVSRWGLERSGSGVIDEGGNSVNECI